MDRKEFLKICGGACASVLGISLLARCAPGLTINGTVKDKELILPLEAFVNTKDGANSFYPYLLVRNEQLNYPVAVFRSEKADFSAMLMRCTHQGMELSVHGNLISCSAHGSEFDTAGKVLQGPADQPLTTFTTRTDATQLYVQLG